MYVQRCVVCWVVWSHQVCDSPCSQLRSLLCSCDLLELADWARKQHLMGLRCYYGNHQNVLVNVAHLNEHNCETGECVERQLFVVLCKAVKCQLQMATVHV